MRGARVTLNIIRINTLDLDVAAEAVAHQVFLLGHQHVIRIARQRIHRDMADHRAELEIRIDRFAQLHRPGAGDKLMMQRGKPQVRVIDLIGEELRAFVEDAGMIPVAQLGRQAVDFIKRNPVFDDVFVTLEQNPAEIQIIVDAAPVGPAVAFLRQRERFSL